MTARLATLSCIGLLLAACEQAEEVAQEPAMPSAAALRIAESSIIIDTHIDVPYRLQRSPADVATATGSGDFDFPRARHGRLNVAFMSI